VFRTTAAMRHRHEQVNAVGGAGEHTNDKRKGMSHTVGTSDEEGTRDRTKPRGSRENPVGFSPSDPEVVRPWNRARKCFRCHQWGHIRIGSTQECRWPEADPKNRGEGGRGEPFPLKQGETDGGDTKGNERRRGGTREERDEWVDVNDGEGENVCDIPGDECGNQGWVQDDKNYDDGSYDRCGEKVSAAIGDEDMGDEREDEIGKRVAIKVALPGTVVASNVDPAFWSIWLEWMTF
jgi:hypothetical protein